MKLELKQLGSSRVPEVGLLDIRRKMQIVCTSRSKADKCGTTTVKGFDVLGDIPASVA
jgi:hypothetical protein